jgi:lysophospholipase L1-like esterase
MKRIIFFLIGIFFTLSVCAGLSMGYLRFAYLIVPFKQGATYEIRLKAAPQDGYFKFQPGTYENVEKGVAYTINEDGFRGATKKSDLKTGYSIIALGESSTMGIEVVDGQTWPEHLHQGLLQKNLDNQILNAGVGGIISTQTLNLYQNELRDLKPNILIYYGGRNDHGLGGGHTRFPGPTAWSQGFWHWFKQYLVFKKAEIRFYQYQLFGKQYVDIFPSINQWLPQYTSNLKKLIEQTLEDKTCFVIAQQLMPFEQPTRRYIQEHQFDLARASISPSNVAWPELFRQVDIYEAQFALSAKYRVPLIELLSAPSFSPEGLFFDVVHLTAAGNKFIASQIAEALPQLCPSLK